MPILSVQLQPRRAPDLDLDAALAILTSAAELAGAELEISEGEDDGPYINFNFTTQDLPRLWEILQGQVFWDRTIGPHLANASIATCQGKRGWDDYLLLHHFDRDYELDKLKAG